MERGLEIAYQILLGHTAGSLRDTQLAQPAAIPFPTFPLAHPTGVRLDPADQTRVYVGLEATFRHRYFEYPTHLYNIQRLKRAQGLQTRVEVPFEGYWALPGWDRSEP